MVVLDTSALLFWTLDSERLSEAASGAISEADRVLVNSISIWEIGINVARGGLTIPLSVREYSERLGAYRTCRDPSDRHGDLTAQSRARMGPPIPR